MYLLLIPTVAVFGYGIFRRLRQWRIGRPVSRFDRPVQRMIRVLRLGLLQTTIWRDPIAGIWHAMLFWGFVTLTVATTIVLIHHDFNIRIMQGRFYLYFQSLFVDILGVVAMIGITIAGIRRWCTRPIRLVYSDEATWILILLLVILASGYLLEGWRIAATDDPWAAWSPVGNGVAVASLAVLDRESLRVAHVITWWGHMALVFGLIAWAPYTKLLHIVTAPLNILTSNLDAPAGSLEPIDFETAETFGVSSIEQFTWKGLLDLDSCTECGQCTAMCPANAIGKQLSPRDIILSLQQHLSAASRQTEKVNGDQPDGSFSVIGSSSSLAPEALWQCTTCAACVHACPVAIEQYPKIVDMRRYLAMEQADLPDTLQDALTSMEQRGHPFRGTQLSRMDWADKLGIPHIKDVDNAEVLLWVGCGGALVERNLRSTRALAKLLQRAGVRFGILGREESCTGDPARRIGNEFLFDTLARQNIEQLHSLGIKTVVTPCPHCFNTFANEYPEFGAQWETLHHTTYLAKLIGENRLQLDLQSARQITMHDPCYLGRHNGITEEPRDLLRHTIDSDLLEMKLNGPESFCCGGGGGMSFIDEPSDQRVNVERAQQAVATGADTVAVGCPFCATMLEDGIGSLAHDSPVEVKDIAELLWEAIDDQPTTSETNT